MKKILGGLFGKKETVVTAKGKIQRSPRVRIPGTEDAQFSAGGKAYPIRNLSESGLALLSPGERFPDEASGEIQIGGQSVFVKLTTVRRNGDEVGATISDGAAGVRGILRRAFADEFHALEMTEVDARSQKAVEIGQPKWFYAPGNYELFFVEHEEKVIRFEIEWSGSVLAFDGSQLRFGIVDGDSRDSVSHARSSLVKWESKVQPEQKRKALRLIENISGLDGNVRKRLQELLR
ncbi:MAG: hypothetical protein ACXVB9_15570 [Bdellovibrionota bacterium]